MTGATGFLGSKLLERLIEQLDIYTVTVIKRSFSDIRRISHLKFEYLDIDKIQFSDLFKEKKYDAIIHCATNYGRNHEKSSEIIESNLVLPLKLLEQGASHGVKMFINTDTILDKNVSDYSLSKKHFRNWLEKFSDRINCINLSLEHFYGPGDNDSKFVTDIIRKLLKKVPALELTKGNQTRDFIYIDDVVDAIMLLLVQNQHNSTGYSDYDIGSGNSISIKEFVSLVKKHCVNDSTLLNFGVIPYRSNEPMHVKIDTSELNKLGWKCNWDIDRGLIQTIKFERKLLSI